MLDELWHRDCCNHGAARSLGWAGLCNGAGYGAASIQQGEATWLCSMVFARASSKVMESLLRAAGAEGVQLRQSWFCPGVTRHFSSSALFPLITRVTFSDILL